MSALNVPNWESWDPFHQRVQRELIDHLGLDNAVISVDRHNGQNKNVGVKLSRRTDETTQSHIDHHDLDTHRIQLTMDQLTSQVQSIVDVLLQDCAVCFGDITISVKRGILEEVVFSYSTRPQESTASFFLVKV